MRMHMFVQYLFYELSYESDCFCRSLDQTNNPSLYSVSGFIILCLLLLLFHVYSLVSTT